MKFIITILFLFNTILSFAQTPQKYLDQAMDKIASQDYNGAILDYNKSINLTNPDNGEPYFRRGLCYFMLGQITQGCTDMRKAGDFGYSAAFDFLKKYCQ